jgi:plastocyanin
MRKMIIRSFFLSLAAVFIKASLCAGTIEGAVVIKKKLTKRRVTASVPLYERGPAVELAVNGEEDPLAFERSRVAVYLEGGLPPAAPAALVRMEQTNRRFSPETLVIPAGTKVSFPNADPIFHNVFSLSSPKMFDLGNYSKGETRMVTFPEPGIVYVNCHLHPNMTAAIVVTPNGWNTLADREGRFALHDVPAGKYTIVAWHKEAGFFRETVQLTAGGNEQVEFLIPLEEDGRKIEPRKHTATR